MRRTVWFICLAAAWAASAREPDGALGLIRAPHDAWPAIVLAGEAFEAELAAPPNAVRLAGSDPSLGTPLSVLPIPGAPNRYRCVVPEDVPAGVYAFVAETVDGNDLTARAVHVVKEFPESYVIAHIAAPGDASLEALREAVQAANAAGAALVLLTGNLTRGGGAEEIRALLDTLLASNAPTYLVPGPADLAAQHYRRYLGEPGGMFWYGPDGYLGVDATLPVPVDPLGDCLARLQMRRRAIKPARWSIGFTTRYALRMTMRAQLILFADDALDYLVASEIELLREGDPAVLPWAPTVGLVPPQDRLAVLLHVTPQGIAPLAASLETAGETP